MKTIQFFSKIQMVEKILFLKKINYKILCIIKKYINFRNYFFSYKQTFSNPNFSTVQSKTPRNVSKKLTKFNKTIIEIQKKGKNRTHIKVKLILPNM